MKNEVIFDLSGCKSCIFFHTYSMDHPCLSCIGSSNCKPLNFRVKFRIDNG